MPLSPHPLLLEPVDFTKPWGVETWLAADLDATSRSGAGGAAVHSRIATGPLAGSNLRDADRELTLGLLPATEAGQRYPLLLKRIIAREHLSVQVHPSERFARAHPTALRKTESWYIMNATEDAELYLGFRDNVTLEMVKRSVSLGEDEILPLLEKVKPVVGACYTLPSGIVHALGAGVEVLEIQTASDTTFRISDWRDKYSRPRREMHVDLALQAMLIDARPSVAPPEEQQLAETNQYRARTVEVTAQNQYQVAPGSLIFVLRGHGSFASTNQLTTNQTWLMPSGCTESISAVDGSMELIEFTCCSKFKNKQFSQHTHDVSALLCDET